MGHLDLDFQKKQGPGAWEHSQNKEEQWEDGQEDPESDSVQDCPGLFVFLCRCMGSLRGIQRSFGPTILYCQLNKSDHH
jgi:hypothetical protein